MQAYTQNTSTLKVLALLQIFNQINARKIRDEYNVFDGLWASKGFLYILAIEIILQVRFIKPTCCCYIYLHGTCVLSQSVQCFPPIT